MNAGNSRQIHLKIDSLTSRGLIYTWLIILAFLIIFFVLGMTVVPNSLYKLPGKEECPSTAQGFTEYCKEIRITDSLVWEGNIFGVTNLDQFMTLSCTPIRNIFDLNTEKDYNFKIKFRVEIFSQKKESERKDQVSYKRNLSSSHRHSENFSCKKFVLKDPKKYCEDRSIVLLPEITYGDYSIRVVIEDPETIKGHVDGFHFEIYTINREYTKYVLGLRYSFQVLSIGFFGLYAWNYTRIPESVRIFEQYYVIGLSIILIFQNDPFTALNLLKPDGVWLIISVTFNSLFISAILFYWMIMFDRIRRENDQSTTRVINFVKIIQAFLIFVFFEAAGVLLSYEILDDPSSLPDNDYPKLYYAFIYTGISLVGLVYAYLLVLSILILCKWKTRLQRHRVFFLFSIYFTICIGILIFSENFKFSTINGVLLIMMLALCNIYVYLMMFLYSVSKSGTRDLKGMQKKEIVTDKTYEYIDQVIDNSFGEEMNPDKEIQPNEDVKPNEESKIPLRKKI